MQRSPANPPDGGIDSPATSGTSSGRPPVLGARAKSVSAPGARKPSPIRQSGASARTPTDPQKVREYRDRLVEIYKKHAPEKNVHVDQLLEKYKGQEEFLYTQVCKRYGKAEGTSGTLEPVGASTGGKAGRAAATNTTRAKAVLPRPPAKSQASVGGANGSAVDRPEASHVEGRTAKPISNGKSVANGTVDAVAHLLMDVDLLLIGEKTGFFDEPMGVSSDSDSELSESAESNSEEEEVVPESTPKTAGTGNASTVANAKVKAKVDAPSGNAGGKQKLHSEAEKSHKQPQVKDTSTGKSAPPKAPARTTVQTKTAEPSANLTEEAIAPAETAVNGADEGDDSDLDDADLSAALAARLDTNDETAEGDKTLSTAESAEASQSVEAAPKAQPQALPKEPSSQPESKDDNSERKSPSIPASRPKKASAPPAHLDEGDSAPSTSAKARASKRDINGVKPKSAPAPAPVPAKPPEPEAPPLFDQWLAVLKFLTGWNDQRSYTNDEIKDALCEHLEDEGIQNSSTIERLCATIVPLLLDLKSIDIAVVKNVKKDILKNLKIIQIYILRIVTFELNRERDAKAASANVKRSKKDSSQRKAGAPYLASDISSLAKTVQHFRFESAFSGGLQKLITAIRAQKKAVVPTKGADGDSKATTKNNSASDAPKRKASEVSGDGRTASPAGKTSSGDGVEKAAKGDGVEKAAKTSSGDGVEKAAPPPLKRQRRMV